MEFEDDNPGVFIRGQDALSYLLAIDSVLAGNTDPLALARLKTLRDLLGTCQAFPGQELDPLKLGKLLACMRSP